MKTVAFAYHNIGIVGLEALEREGFEIQAVFSHRDDPREHIWFGSVVEWAKRKGIPISCPENVNTAEWLDRIRRLAPEVLFSFYYRHLLGRELLGLSSAGAFNLHGSLLPAYRGRCPVNWVLVNGERRTGVTLHHMVEAPDAGDIVGQKEIPIAFDDTALTLYRKLCEKAEELLAETLPLIRQGIAPRIAQDPKQASYFGGRRPEDGRIDWSWPVMRIYNLIRAVTEPYPGAFTLLPGGEKLLIWWARPETRLHTGETGTLELEGDHVFVRASDGALKLLDIQAGNARMKGNTIAAFFEKRKGVVLR